MTFAAQALLLGVADPLAVLALAPADAAVMEAVVTRAAQLKAKAAEAAAGALGL